MELSHQEEQIRDQMDPEVAKAVSGKRIALFSERLDFCG